MADSVPNKNNLGSINLGTTSTARSLAQAQRGAVKNRWTGCLPLVSAQIRAARALLRWTAEDLARASAVGLTTIRRAELTERETSLTAANDLAIRNALEAAGVVFIDENGGGAGVRLRDPSGYESPVDHLVEDAASIPS
jgi:transcriptional regulator with XRE-family HTH domain